MNSTPSFYTPHPAKVSPFGCVSIIGMAAAGKTTIGRELSTLLGWPQVDTDHLIESTYGANLQSIAVSMSKDAFLDLEGAVISGINLRRAVVSTGGSAVYRQTAMQKLHSLGPVIYISVPLPVIMERIARKPDRGMAMAPGQTVEDLYNERTKLYEAAADFIVKGGNSPAEEYAHTIAGWLDRER
ncbi:MAG: shikimate kinase [Desulfovibrio sp.]|nr:shikimate kinase [Desulfovibrio sp.]